MTSSRFGQVVSLSFYALLGPAALPEPAPYGRSDRLRESCSSGPQEGEFRPRSSHHLGSSLLPGSQLTSRPLQASQIPQLPVELIAPIIRLSLPSPSFTTLSSLYSSLRSYSLVSPTWRYTSQEHLFTHVSLASALEATLFCGALGEMEQGRREDLLRRVRTLRFGIARRKEGAFGDSGVARRVLEMRVGVREVLLSGIDAMEWEPLSRCPGAFSPVCPRKRTSNTTCRTRFPPTALRRLYLHSTSPSPLPPRSLNLQRPHRRAPPLLAPSLLPSLTTLFLAEISYDTPFSTSFTSVAPQLSSLSLGRIIHLVPSFPIDLTLCTALTSPELEDIWSRPSLLTLLSHPLQSLRIRAH